jgi:hypothetical protein
MTVKETYMKPHFNAGEFKMHGRKKLMIVGHIWWPVEKCNAYHCLHVTDTGEPREPEYVEYIWDHVDGTTSEFKDWTPLA